MFYFGPHLHSLEGTMIARNSKTLLFIIVAWLIIGVTEAQNYNLSLNRDNLNLIEQHLHSTQANFHTAILPYQTDEVLANVNKDSIYNTLYTGNTSKGLLYRKLRKENLIDLKKDDFKLIINPIVNLELGRDLAKTGKLYVNTRGVDVSGAIGDKFVFHSSFFENQARFPAYISAYALKNNVIPGQGFIRVNNGVFDYATATGYVSYTASKHFNFQLGNDKTFIGDGYRSLFLSDNSFNYPYIKVNATAWKFKYMFMVNQMLDLRFPHRYEMGFVKKYGIFHYLSFNATKRLNIGFFESIIAGSVDSTGAYRGFSVEYLNPVIFLRPVEFAIGSPDNAGMGLGFKYKLTDNTHLYGQIFIDEFNLAQVLGKKGKGWYANKQAAQLGVKAYDVFKISNLYFQTEINYVPPFTYSHFYSLTNYANYGQALAHTLGSNFYESMSFLRYRWKSFFVETKFMAAVQGQDPAGQNLGNDIFKEYKTKTREYGNYLTQGIRNVILFEDIRLVYILNPRYNLNLELGIVNRQQRSDIINDQTHYVYFGVKTNLINKYYDF